MVLHANVVKLQRELAEFEKTPMNPLLKKIDRLKKYTDVAIFWVIVLIALSQGLG
jgi:hypothetical protein